MKSFNSRMESRNGFTLAELLVVLTILAIVALAAVKSLAPVAEQTRFQTTQRTLQELRSAILNVDANNSSTASVSGFIADNGRVPVLISGAVDPFVELYDGTGSTDLIPFAYYSFPFTDPSSGSTYAYPQSLILRKRSFLGQDAITSTASTNDIYFPSKPAGSPPFMIMSVGWRGPYIQRPIGSRSIVDGWGDVLVPTTVVGSDSRSYVTGAVSAHATELVPLATTWQNVSGNKDYLGSLSGNVTVTVPGMGTSCYLSILLFQPQPSVSNPLGFIAHSHPTQLVASSTESTVPVSYSFPNAYVGPRVLCAACSVDSPIAPMAPVSYYIVGQPWYVTIKPTSVQGPTWSLPLPANPFE